VFRVVIAMRKRSRLNIALLSFAALCLLGAAVSAAPDNAAASRQVTVVIPLKWLDAEAFARSCGWAIIPGSILSGVPAPSANLSGRRWGRYGLGGQGAGLYGISPSYGGLGTPGLQPLVSSRDNSLLMRRSSPGLRRQTPVPVRR